MTRQFYLLGCASGIAGADIHSGDGPLVLQQALGAKYPWHGMVSSPPEKNIRMDEAVAMPCRELALMTSTLLKQSHSFCVLGGDHTCAIGTWSGVYDVLRHQGDLGLIWVDAHMDSHTPETTESGRIHGMPLACLLGYGYPTLTGVMHHQAKLKPENICLIGVRSFEHGEAEFLKKLNVRIYFMDEVKSRGIDAVMQEAAEYVSRNTVGYGISLDLDAIDPNDAPGVDVPEPDGISAAELSLSLKKIVKDPRLIGSEIVEFDPTRDQNQKTEKLALSILDIFAGKA